MKAWLLTWAGVMTAVALCATMAQGELYKWKDAEGVIHVTSTPPPDEPGVEVLSSGATGLSVIGGASREEPRRHGQARAPRRQDDPEPTYPGALTPRRPLPNVWLTDMDGRRVRFSDYRGRPLLLVFWASWCPSCRQELPRLVAVADDLARRHIDVMTVNIDEDEAKARAYMEKIGMSWPTVAAGGWKAEVMKRFGVHSIPRVMVVDGEQRLASNDFSIAVGPQFAAHVEWFALHGEGAS